MIGYRPETQSKHLLSNLGRKNYDSNELNQISYNSDPSNKIFYLQSHYKATAAFEVNSFFITTSWFKYTQNIYTLFKKHLHTFASCILTSKQFYNSQETTCATSYLLKLHEKETLAQLFFCKFCENFKNTFL